jgi:hypothetical protein
MVNGIKRNWRYSEEVEPEKSMKEVTPLHPTKVVSVTPARQNSATQKTAELTTAQASVARLKITQAY